MCQLLTKAFLRTKYTATDLSDERPLTNLSDAVIIAPTNQGETVILASTTIQGAQSQPHRARDSTQIAVQRWPHTDSGTEKAAQIAEKKETQSNPNRRIPDPDDDG